MYKKIKHYTLEYATLNNAVLVVAVLIMLSWLGGTIGAIQRNFELQQRVDDISQQISLYELENETLEFQQRYYASAEYQELSAREHFNKAAPGEKLINLPPIKAKSRPVETQPKATTSIKDRSNFAQWMYFLFGQKA